MTKPDAYLARFPAEHRESVDRAYSDGFSDGVSEGYVDGRADLAELRDAVRAFLDAHPRSRRSTDPALVQSWGPLEAAFAKACGA